MKTAKILFIVLVIASIAGISCKSKKPKADEIRHFQPVMIPTTLQEDQFRPYMEEHYWDNVPFDDAEFFLHADTTSMLRAFVQYAAQMVPWDNPAPTMSALMKRASVNKPALEFFAMLADKSLYYSESPVRSDELYIPVLEALIASPFLDQYEKMPYEYRLHMAQQNRIGSVANDFTYTTASGRTGTLHKIPSKYTLLYLNNPGCPMCGTITEGLTKSELVTRLMKERKLTILAIYPDEDLTAWREHLKDFPATWIVGYDAGTHMSNDELYDLRAIPSIYLLDKEKKVLAKDLYHVPHIEAILAQEEGITPENTPVEQ